MRADLAAHDVLLRDVIEANSGQLFKHTGDGTCAVFTSPDDAVRATIAAQRKLELPVRMGMATGEAHAHDGDYFGPILNRAARVMSAGHGGQILVADSTAALLAPTIDYSLADLGARQLRDISEQVGIFQVEADGLATDFAPLKTIDAIRGNLPEETTSFIGRAAEVLELSELVTDNRLVTLVGVGGAGKTRLSLRVADSLVDEFTDGVWLVELAPITDATALPEALANALRIHRQPGMSTTESLCAALDGRRLLLVLDNCEHLVVEAADLVDELLAKTTIAVLATSREALDVAGEVAWPIPPLDVDGGADSSAVTLFVERARAAKRGFALETPAMVDAVTEVCARLDGIALAIELAAARMVSMSPEEVRDRLDDRFRLLGNSKRGLARHQTLRQAVQWSHDLLEPDERHVLNRCSVFADGFDLAAAQTITGFDEYETLDILDSLVRKSLVTADQTQGTSRYSMLETIRQFGDDQLDAEGARDQTRQRHGDYFATMVEAMWTEWDSPNQRVALDTVDREFANIRLAFRHSVETNNLDQATLVAAHTAIIVWPLQRFEPVQWSEELVPAAAAAKIAQLPRLYVAASLVLYGGRPDVGVTYAQEAAAIESDPQFDGFEYGWSGVLEALAHLFGGRIERRVEICTELAKGTGFARVVGLCGLAWALPAVGRGAEAAEIADETLAVARDFGNPFWIGWAMGGYGRAYADTKPVLALDVLREGLDYAEQNRLPFWQANLSQDAARLEAVHGDFDEALTLFERSIDSFYRAGNVVFLAATLASLAVFFDRFDEPEIAAVLYGSCSRHGSIRLVPSLSNTVERIETKLGSAEFAQHVAIGAAMDTAAAVRHANEQIRLADRAHA